MTDETWDTDDALREILRQMTPVSKDPLTSASTRKCAAAILLLTVAIGMDRKEREVEARKIKSA